MKIYHFLSLLLDIWVGQFIRKMIVWLWCPYNHFFLHFCKFGICFKTLDIVRSLLTKCQRYTEQGGENKPLYTMVFRVTYLNVMWIWNVSTIANIIYFINWTNLSQKCFAIGAWNDTWHYTKCTSTVCLLSNDSAW